MSNNAYINSLSLEKLRSHIQTQDNTINSLKQYISELEHEIQYYKKDTNSSHGRALTPNSSRSTSKVQELTRVNAAQAKEIIELKKKLKDSRNNSFLIDNAFSKSKLDTHGDNENNREIMDLKEKIAKLEYELDVKGSELETYAKKIKNLEASSESILRTRRIVELGNKEQNPLVIELKAAKEHIDILEKELKNIEKFEQNQAKNYQMKIEKLENDLKKVHANDVIVRKKNLELSERVKLLERQLTLYTNQDEKEKSLENPRIDSNPFQKPIIDDRINTPTDQARNLTNDSNNLLLNKKSSSLLQNQGSFNTRSRRYAKDPEHSSHDSTDMNILRQELVHTKKMLQAAEKTIQDLSHELMNQLPTRDNKGVDNSRKHMNEIDNNDENQKNPSYLKSKLIDQIQRINELEGEVEYEKKEKRELEEKINNVMKNHKIDEEFFNKEIHRLNEELMKCQLQNVDEKKKFLEYMNKMTFMSDDMHQQQLDNIAELQNTINQQKLSITQLEKDISMKEIDHANAVKKIESELELVKEYNFSHLREIENFQWQKKRFEKEIENNKLEYEKLQKKNMEFASQIKDFESKIFELNSIIKKLLDAQESTKHLQDSLDKNISLNSSQKQSNLDISQYNINLTKKPKEEVLDLPVITSNPYEPITFDELCRCWETLQDPRDQIRGVLLQKVLKQPSLMQEAMLQKRKFFYYLVDGLDNQVYLNYEPACQVLAEFIDRKIITIEEIKGLQCSKSAIKSLTQARNNEQDTDVITRHYAGLKILCYMDDNEEHFDEEMVQCAEEYHIIKTLLGYIEQNYATHEWQKQRSSQILAMITRQNNTNINREIRKAKGITTLIKNLPHPNIYIKRYAAETLSYLFKDVESRALLTNEEDVRILLDLLIKATDQDLLSYIYDSFTNLSLIPLIKKALLDEIVLDHLVLVCGNDKSIPHVLQVYQIFLNIATLAEIRMIIYDKMLNNLFKSTLHQNVQIRMIALSLYQKLIEENSKFENDLKLFPAILDSLFSEEVGVYSPSLHIMLLLCTRYPQTFLDLLSKKLGITAVAKIYLITNDIKAIEISSNLLLLLASTTIYTRSVIEQGSEKLIRRLFDDLEDLKIDFNMKMKCANILQFIMNDITSHKAIQSSPKSVNALFKLLADIRASDNMDENTLIAILIMKNLSINPAFIGMLRANKIVEVLLKMLASEKFTPNIQLEAIMILENLAKSPEKRSIAYDILSVQNGYGLTILTSIIVPANERNPKAVKCIPVWECVANEVASEIFLSCVMANQDKILLNMVKLRKETEIPKLYYIFNNILSYLVKATSLKESIKKYEASTNLS